MLETLKMHTPMLHAPKEDHCGLITNDPAANIASALVLGLPAGPSLPHNPALNGSYSRTALLL